jgi:hypothetical protein
MYFATKPPKRARPDEELRRNITLPDVQRLDLAYVSCAAGPARPDGELKRSGAPPSRRQRVALLPSSVRLRSGRWRKTLYLLSSPGAGARGHIIGKRVPGCEQHRSKGSAEGIAMSAPSALL